MSKHAIKPMCLAVGLAFAGTASAVTFDFSGSNFYMKFLDGSQQGAPTGSIDTASGGDQGQFTEMNLIFKAMVSPQVEAGGRIQSRSSAGYWSEAGGWNENGNVTVSCPNPIPAPPPNNFTCTGSSDNNINHQKFMKLRGAYIELSPGYSWLSQVRIGTSDWGMFDPFTVGKVRYIDRDNYHGLYFKGPIAKESTWEVARISVPTWFQKYSDAAQYNEAVYIAQFKAPVPGGVKLAGSYQLFDDRAVGNAASFAGQNKISVYQNRVASLKAEGGVIDGLDLRGAYYLSSSKPSTGQTGNWNAPPGEITDRAYKVDVDYAPPVDGLSFSLQHFNIGAGYASTLSSRRETDVLLTEGSEAAWFNWASWAPIWAGGATSDYTQSPSTFWAADNAFMDFNESPAESVVGWKGMTVVGKYEVASTPMSLEITRIGYNNNWENNTGPLSGWVYAAYQDKTTDIMAFKVGHVFNVLGGLDVNGKVKRVNNTDKMIDAASDDRETKDNGISVSVGNQLTNHLYGTFSVGQYTRDAKDTSVSANTAKNSKNIVGLRFAYNLPGFEFGMMMDWIKGKQDFTYSGTSENFSQYRMKAFSQVNF